MTDFDPAACREFVKRVAKAGYDDGYVANRNLYRLAAELESLLASAVAAAVEPLEKRLREEEMACLELIAERDLRDDVITRLCAGHKFSFDFEWTSHYGFEEAIEDVADKRAALEASIETRVAAAVAGERERLASAVEEFRTGDAFDTVLNDIAAGIRASQPAPEAP